MRKFTLIGVSLLTAGALSVTACGAGSPNSGSDEAGGTVTIGVLTSLTGAAAAAFSNAEDGVKARIEAQNAQGGVNGTKVKYVVADDKSSPDGALTAAKDLVQNRGATAIISVTSFISGAQPFLLQQGIPTIGGGFSGNEWSDPKNTNMFSSIGSVDYNLPATTIPAYLKDQGVTKLGLLGFTGTASSTLTVQTVASAAESIGLEVAYQNVNLPIGSTDVGAIAIAMRDAGVDGVYLPVNAPTAFALTGALKQLGVKLTSTLLPNGYGNDLLQQPAAVQESQGTSFASNFPPVELGTTATDQVVENFKTYANITGPPGFAQYTAYVAADAYLRGLQENDGKSATKTYIDSLRKVTDYDASGLYTSPVDFSAYGNLSPGVGPGNCTYVSTLTGAQFVPVPTASPKCGELVN